MTPVSYDGPYPSRAAAIGWLEDGRGFYPMESATILRAGGAEPAELVVVVVRGPGVREWALQVQEANSELTPEERRVLERKLKKERKKEEKKRLREAGIAAAQTAKGQTLPAKPSAAVLALEYLQGWAQKQESWRFQKTRQTWLLMNMYDEDKVPDEHFSTLLDYLEGLKGSARELTVQKAEALMQELDEADTETRDTQLGKMERLRQVLQLLS
ncbi:Uncharacterized protein C7orf50-like [Cricetulus griseus]|uniref:Uncharacterized protein C7orf50-like n=1 Tax=Cricetulus griseus TaxID=10029 RepID=G3HUP4_CRIGR|nr:Uncharacterized protein C7orf50-like [Cricetulus griseus]